MQPMNDVLVNIEHSAHHELLKTFIKRNEMFTEKADEIIDSNIEKKANIATNLIIRRD